VERFLELSDISCQIFPDGSRTPARLCRRPLLMRRPENHCCARIPARRVFICGVPKGKRWNAFTPAGSPRLLCSAVGGGWPMPLRAAFQQGNGPSFSAPVVSRLNDSVLSADQKDLAAVFLQAPGKGIGGPRFDCRAVQPRCPRPAEFLKRKPSPLIECVLGGSGWWAHGDHTVLRGPRFEKTAVLASRFGRPLEHGQHGLAIRAG